MVSGRGAMAGGIVYEPFGLFLLPAAGPSELSSESSSNSTEIIDCRPGMSPRRRRPVHRHNGSEGTYMVRTRVYSYAPRDRILQHWIVIFRFTLR